MGKISKEDEILIKNLRIGINFAKLTRVWLALISLTAKINSLLFCATLYVCPNHYIPPSQYFLVFYVVLILHVRMHECVPVCLIKPVAARDQQNVYVGPYVCMHAYVK